MLPSVNLKDISSHYLRFACHRSRCMAVDHNRGTGYHLGLPFEPTALHHLEMVHDEDGYEHARLLLIADGLRQK
jgi:hypothetical protein